MHIEKNICDSIIGTLLNIEGNTKDTMKARLNLKDMNIRKELHLQQRQSGFFKPPFDFYTTTSERRGFFQFLKFVKFPDDYASNIARCVNNLKGKILV